MQPIPIRTLDLPPEETYSSLTTKKLISSIRKADRGESALDYLALSVEGLSSIKTRGLLNNLMGHPDSRYLEVGCWKGSTLTAALYNNSPAYHAAVESFAECESDIRDTLEKNCMRVLGARPNFVFSNCFSVNCKAVGIENINVYFYDGNHSRESTKKGITHFYDAMAPEFILLLTTGIGRKWKRELLRVSWKQAR